MDLEMLEFRASVMQKIREFFIKKGFLELDTPALSRDLIPETCLEVFKTEYIKPWTEEKIPLYLVPSPEIYIKKIISQHKKDVFQISKCYRNIESVGNIHSPEFTMLEYYKMNASYMDTARLTEELFNELLPPKPDAGQPDPFSYMRPPFYHLRIDDAFKQYAGFALASCPESADLARHARELGLEESKDNPFESWAWDDLYELILVHCVEPHLPKDVPVMLMDYPAKVPCLAQEFYKNGMYWKERFELYCAGIELCNCYSEETDPKKIKKYFEDESEQKKKFARIQHETDENYWKIFESFPKCSGNAIGVDRLIALLSGHKTIESVLPFLL
ncbi:MAG: LysR family transcriptional regulator [Treponema sp.]|uniref:amino acid--tRNA ligase-related protein n=1 Tax=Treponema sp. TaxID=166 RepID=UPI00298D6D39|nr:amino acid--tRNA ligase-related protein [Treponema sp.]MCR5386082.1 LysR family transcriptional regulator [Treponema sp.]